MSETPGGGIKFVISADIPAVGSITQVTEALRTMQQAAGVAAPEAFKQAGAAVTTAGDVFTQKAKMYQAAGATIEETAKAMGTSVKNVNAALGNVCNTAGDSLSKLNQKNADYWMANSRYTAGANQQNANYWQARSSRDQQTTQQAKKQNGEY